MSQKTPRQDKTSLLCDRNPPSRINSWRSRLIRMVFMKVLNESGIHNVVWRDPLSFLRSITLPVNKVLSALTLFVYHQQLLDLIYRTAINHFRWRGRCDGWNHGTSFCWFHLTYVKGRVYKEGPGQTKSHCCRTDDLIDGEWTHKPWHQLLGGNLKVQILGC